jgi:hypothetical protein
VSITCNLAAVRSLTPGELAWRFVLGGTITGAAGLIAKIYGPEIGGLFLAFPAILPASLTLVARHQERRKAEVGLRGVVRGRQAAALDALGAFLGTPGLMGFALSVQLAAARMSALLTLMVASAAWLAIATGLWRWRHRSPRRQLTRSADST